MQAALRKQIDEMPEDELRDVIRRDYMRRLTRYRNTDQHFRNKYGMDFESFEECGQVEKSGFSFEVESDSQTWEQAMDGILTVERKLKELAGGH